MLPRRPKHNPWRCPECGMYQSGGAPEPGEHECDERTLIRYQTETLELTWKQFLESREGQFAVYVAIKTLRG